MLTHEQWKLLCMLWPQRDENRRWLINAPSGSGKTFVAVRLACEFVLHPRLLGMQAQAGAVLLCSHSRRLQQKTVEEVNEYLAETEHQVDMAEQQYVTTITSKTTGVRLVVSTIDALLTDYKQAEGDELQEEGAGVLPPPATRLLPPACNP